MKKKYRVKNYHNEGRRFFPQIKYVWWPFWINIKDYVLYEPEAWNIIEISKHNHIYEYGPKVKTKHKYRVVNVHGRNDDYQTQIKYRFWPFWMNIVNSPHRCSEGAWKYIETMKKDCYEKNRHSFSYEPPNPNPNNNI